MAGYWQRPEETAAVMTPEGYLRTGDLGRIDEDGHLVPLDRKKDLIIAGGFRIVPAEIEHVVAQVGGVRECAVIGVPDARRGQTIKVVVVKDDPQSERPTREEIHAHCEQHLSGHMRPRLVEFVAALPRTSGGRVLRRELRAAA
jgi:long-chain acyl-CoA synthetase